MPIVRQCELLKISRSSYYYEPSSASDEDEQLMALLDAEYTLHPEKGVISMRDFLVMLGYVIGLKRTRRLLRTMGVEAIYRKPRLSKLGNAKYIRPYLLKHLTIDHVNQVWATDITYIPMKRGYMYLTAIIYVFSRYIVGWGLFNTLEAANSLAVLKDAIARNGKPEIINSDQGSQFTCNDWIGYLDSEKIKISMDGKGRAIDNIFIERFWRTVKYDYLYLWSFDTATEVTSGLS